MCGLNGSSAVEHAILVATAGSRGEDKLADAGRRSVQFNTAGQNFQELVSEARMDRLRLWGTHQHMSSPQ